jgi:hypothetical protein|tara:strand:+ start:10821 stop:11021 length:201 start_codon:yes stop_codon:yes gene_type:complete
MASKPTVASVHTDLKSHEKMCEERWKTIFNETADLKHEIRSVNLQLKAGLGILVVGMGSILSAQLF